MKKSIIILISGTGSNMQAIIDAAQSGRIDADIKAVISNRPEAEGLIKAQYAGIYTQVIDQTKYSSKSDFDVAILSAVIDLDPDLILLAGYMKILDSKFVDRYHDRLLNIHPSLLPAYKGLHTHQRVIDDGCTIHGASVHFVTEELDSGSVIIQSEIPVEDDDAENLAQKVLKTEHIIYPVATQWFIDGRLTLQDNKAVFDDHEITKPALWKEDKLTLPQ